MFPPFDMDGKYAQDEWQMWHDWLYGLDDPYGEQIFPKPTWSEDDMLQFDLEHTPYPGEE